MEQFYNNTKVLFTNVLISWTKGMTFSISCTWLFTYSLNYLDGCPCGLFAHPKYHTPPHTAISFPIIPSTLLSFISYFPLLPHLPYASCSSIQQHFVFVLYLLLRPPSLSIWFFVNNLLSLSSESPSSNIVLFNVDNPYRHYCCKSHEKRKKKKLKIGIIAS